MIFPALAVVAGVLTAAFVIDTHDTASDKATTTTTNHAGGLPGLPGGSGGGGRGGGSSNDLVTTVPANLEGGDVPTARAALQRLNLTALVVFVCDDPEHLENRVLRLEPAPGTLVATGSSVTLFATPGPSVRATVPVLEGLTLADAEAEAAQSRLVATVYPGDSTDPTHQVTKQFIDPGTEVAACSKIEMNIAP